jgi:hypothetical protein
MVSATLARHSRRALELAADRWGVGIHWPALDEDISVGNLLAGRASGESQQSLKRWLDKRVSEAEVESEE